MPRTSKTLIGWGQWKEGPLPRDARPELRSLRDVVRTWIGGKYSVQVKLVACDWGLVEHFMVRRHDGAPVSSWADKQRIKDELAGPERVAVEVFPPRSRLVDDANMYHLWILPEGFVMPFGLHVDDRGR